MTNMVDGRIPNYTQQNYIYDDAHGSNLEERKKSMKNFFADGQEEVNDVNKVRGFTKVRALLKDFENDSAFDISAIDIQSNTSPRMSEKYLEVQKNQKSDATGADSRVYNPAKVK